MINIKSVMCTLHVKWMNRLCTDAGTTWSRIIWPKIKNVIPTNLISGLTGITEQSLNSLPQFYRSIIRSYVHVNNLFYLENKDLSLPYNLFGTQLHPRIRPRWVEMGLLCAADLPLKGKRIDYDQIKALLGPESSPNLYIFCSSLQRTLTPILPSLLHGDCHVNAALLVQMKSLLQENNSSFQSLTHWEQ